MNHIAIHDWVDLLQDYRNAGYHYPTVVALKERYTKMFGTAPPQSFVESHRETVYRLHAAAQGER